MTISFDIPEDIARPLRESGADLARMAREAFLLLLYREGHITHRQLQDALGLSFHEAEVLLKERGMGQDIDPEEFEAGRDFLRKSKE